MTRSLLIRAAMLTVLVLFAAIPAAAHADYSEAQLKADLKLFEDAKLPHGDQDLLAFFRARLLNDKDRARIEELIKQLASSVFKERDQARADVEKIGPPALPLLRKVMQSNAELEVKLRAERSIKAIGAKWPNSQVMAAARILKHRQTEGAAAVLMEYLPIAPDETVEEEINISIYGLALVGAKLNVLPPAVRAGKLDSRMVASLNDKDTSRRAIAALVVGCYGDAEQRKLAAKLIGDEAPLVRYRAAQGMIIARDKSSMPVLVDLLDKGPLNLALQAEDLLGVIAREKGPVVPLGETKELRQKCHDAWKDWLDKNTANIDLGKVEIDSPFGTTAARAGNGAMAFIKTVFLMQKLDLPAVAKVTDVPFSIFGELIFNTRQEFDDFLKMQMADKDKGPPPDIKFKVTKVVSAAEYLKNAPEKERAFLQAARPAQIHVVYVLIQEGPGQGQEAIPIFIRLSGGRARSLGLGMPSGIKQ